jgi:hypothetical protein
MMLNTILLMSAALLSMEPLLIEARDYTRAFLSPKVSYSAQRTIPKKRPSYTIK